MAQFHIRQSQDRGGSDKGWLKTFHSFSVDAYPQKEYPFWGSLKVLNEDRVEAFKGFGEHGHKEFEIFSYVVSGELEHQDSMGNTEVLRRGDVQLTSAGTGIRHSEKAHGDTQVHFLQIWVTPSVNGLTPKYFTRHFTDDEKRNKWVRVVAPVGSTNVSEEREGGGPAPVHSPITLYASLLAPTKSIEHTLPLGNPTSAEQKAYLHVAQTSGYNPEKGDGAHIQLDRKIDLREGDGAFIVGPPQCQINIANVGDRVAEILWFDVK